MDDRATERRPGVRSVGPNGMDWMCRQRVKKKDALDRSALDDARQRVADVSPG